MRDDICRACGQTRDNHTGVRHPFTTDEWLGEPAAPAVEPATMEERAAHRRIDALETHLHGLTNHLQAIATRIESYDKATLWASKDVLRNDLQDRVTEARELLGDKQ